MAVKPTSPWLISAQEVAFLQNEIGCGNPVRAKRALQAVCKLYRNGGRITGREIVSFETTILGALTSDLSDEKVRRWALSAISNLGQAQQSWSTVLNVLTKHTDEPQVVSAAIAALYKLDRRGAGNAIAGKDFLPPELIALSALQTVPAKQLDLSGVRINIDKAEATTLKLSLVLVGLDKAPENIFHPSYTNGAIVKELGGHDDGLVSQYSAWAVAENPHLTVSDLGIDPSKIDDQPANVRSYVYRLFGAEKMYTNQQHEIICFGSDDDSAEARLGLAVGLRDTYYDGLDVVGMHWVIDERDEDVRDHLLDHIARNAKFSAGYHRIAVEFYDAAEDNPGRRKRMEAAAAGTPLFAEFRRKALKEEEGRLFSDLERSPTVTNTFNNYGTIQGQTSVAGTNNVEGNQQNMLAINEAEKAIEALGQAKYEIDAIKLPDDLAKEVTVAITEAQASPTKDRLGAAVTALKKVQQATASIEGAAGSAVKIGSALMTLTGFLA